MTETHADKRAFFDYHADGWDADYQDPGELPRLRTVLAEAGLRPGQRILEAGCGTGRITPVVLDLVGANGRVVGMDFSLPMLRQARDRAAAAGAGWVLADAHRPCFCPSAFDAVLLYNFFPHLSRKAEALAAMARLLRPAGRLVICHLTGREKLNAFHAGVGSAVAHDMIPPREVVSRMLADARLGPVIWREAEDLYLVVGEAGA
ncbi:MAG TPA: methyltransferase domain-containing protein [Acidobacteriota bacterium]|nr:methyltransferase domain-containing protein [Acidobacteriota bacterium]HOT00921.1 methyltransferase domain-containing protein [Acidobacteriota bacterium]HQF85709.1 methyltransferase domain-containing protein [Acidobacteriota bacterium]HQG91047.1 methyltransferase domain-containing protein [Acidobacteriota bacterium]HQK86129.1 methyltransferase domain-containing protein [Acidobacteriota bacterium]